MTLGTGLVATLGLFVLATWLAGCGAGPGEGQRVDASRASPIVPLDTGTVRIATGEDTFQVSVELAATPEQRRIGLMERRSLPDDEGMLFLFPEQQPADGGFYMFRTFVPLDIAFLDGEGRIVAIRSMEPCTSPVPEWCDRYEPGVPYDAALEVNRGYFEARGIGLGDRVVVPAGAYPPRGR